jgi:hypothetical protein
LVNRAPDDHGANEADGEPKDEEALEPKVSHLVHDDAGEHGDESQAKVLDGLHEAIGGSQLVFCGGRDAPIQARLRYQRQIKKLNYVSFMPEIIEMLLRLSYIGGHPRGCPPDHQRTM